MSPRTDHAQETPMTRPVRARLVPAAASLALVLAALTGCSALDSLTGSDDPSTTPSASPTAAETPYDSQFTRDGTFQSHIDVNGVDFVYTLYPTKSTPRTNEWYPKGKKFFSFTFQAYDLDRELRDDFSTKRKVYLDHMQVSSETRTDSGDSQHPYQLDVVAKDHTFDPEPVTTKYGMIVTSPKGAFELRNQKIGPMSMDTHGVDLLFTATVWIQKSAGSDSYYKREIKQRVPIAIFASKKPTDVASIPVDAN
jgi:hypothetical protein